MTLAELRRQIARLEQRAPTAEDYESRLARALDSLEALGQAEAGRVVSFVEPPKCRAEIGSLWQEVSQ